MDIYAIVTDRIINLLESGVVPWRRPWPSISAECRRNFCAAKIIVSDLPDPRVCQMSPVRSCRLTWHSELARRSGQRCH